MPAAPATAPDALVQHVAAIGAAAGASTEYAGTSSQLDVFTYPSPKPQPSTLTIDRIRRVVRVSNAGNPFGSGEASMNSTVETDTTPLQTETSKTDSYYSLLRNSPSKTLLFGSTTTDELNNVISTAFVRPQIVEELPQRNGATWSNDPARTISEKDADGNLFSRVYSSDGSYVENDVLYGYNGPANFPTIDVNYIGDARGVGSFRVTRNYGGNLNPKTYAQLVDVVRFGAPSGRHIVVSYAQYTVPSPPASPSPPPPLELVTRVSRWFNQGSSLFAQTNVVKLMAIIPASCNVPASFGRAATRIDQTSTSLDDVLGTSDTAHISQYSIAQRGSVCVQLEDTTYAYYDYNQDWFDPEYLPSLPYGSLSPLLAFSTTRKPLESSSFKETLTLQAPGASALPAVGIAPAAIEEARMALERWKMHQHVLRISSLAHRYRGLLKPGGAVQ
jgi:hypothetical protein